MTHPSDAQRARPEPEPPGQSVETLRPGIRVIASSWGPVPQRPLDALVEHVQPSAAGDLVIDWHLTNTGGDHSPAESAADIVDLFGQWRARWTRSVALETTFNLSHLLGLVDAIRPPGVGDTWATRCSEVLAHGQPATIDTSELEAVQADCDGLREMVQQRGASAIGAIDLTPDAGRVGLAASWAVASDRSRLVATDRAMSVLTTTEGALVAVPRATTDGDVTIEIDEVAITDRDVEVGDGPDRHVIPVGAARPLTWLVPGATRWRIRTVPEVLVWASTFAELPDLCEESRALDRVVRLAIDDDEGALSAPTPSP